MYPLTQWSYSDLCARLSILEGNNLHAESIVVINQLLEQIIKRYLMKEINTQRQYWDKKTRKWMHLNTVADRDAVVRAACEPDNWQVLWRKLLHEKQNLPTMPEAFDHILGPNAWTMFVSKTSVQLPVSSKTPRLSLKYGFRQCRHTLVHGTTSPRLLELEVLSSWGHDAVKRLLHPESGWPSLLGWNAQSRLPAFRNCRNGG